MSAIKAVVAWEATRAQRAPLVLRTQSQVLFVGRSSSQAGKSYGALPLQTDSQFFSELGKANLLFLPFVPSAFLFLAF